MMVSKLVWLKLVFLMFVLLENCCCSEGCWEQERITLLQIKHFFNRPGFLTKWVEGDENSDCCQWEGVTCNTSTGKVKELRLSDTRNWDSGEWYLNASLFTPFQELDELFLDDNNIAGCIENEGFERLTSLKTLFLSYNQLRELNVNGLSNLEILDLSGNILGHSILSSITNLSSLRILELSNIGFNGTFDFKEIESLSNLEELHLGYNRIDKFVVPEDYKGLNKLNTLYLNGVGMNDESILLQSMRSFPALETLYLGDNNLTGAAFTQGLCALVHLETLIIYNNDIRDSLPWCLTNMTSLQELTIPYNQLTGSLSSLANMTSLLLLDISFNQLTGNISSSPLVHLTSIQELILSSNQFQIPISLQPFFNHSNLKSFFGDGNQIYAEAKPSSLVPKFQLKYFELSGHLGGETFPKFLYHQHDLIVVDLSHIKLTGEFPNWLLENNTNLYSLILVNNSLSGPIEMPNNSQSLLKKLNISENAFNGSIPSSFGNMSSLLSLDLSNNELIGEIPEHLAMGCLSLQLLVLSNNNLQGHIFSKSSNLISLLRLQLDGNHFIGEIPKQLSNSSLLAGLYLSDNSLSGKIPRWLGNMSHLEDIIMPSNDLEGPIPTEFCQLNSLQLLDISDNNLSGSIPSCFSPSSIKQVHLAKNMLQGKLNNGTFYNSSSLVTLDLSYNYLNGSIPKWIDRLSCLTYLLLANNNLDGEIPFQLCQLNKLRLIDLSHNHLSGQIPPCLDNTSLHKVYYTSTTPTSHYSLNFYTGYPMAKEETIAFTTKEISYSYRGKPLKGMFGIDLSCNNLTGKIFPEIGYLTMIRVLNLSHNNLMGSIPFTFSNLKQIESLDLSYNKLNGEIPPQLVELNALAVFTVAYNNLSGKIPEWIAQFATFNASSYEGNPLLCGLPLPRSCNENGLRPSMPKVSNDKEEDDNLIDMESFYVTFVVSYAAVLFVFILVLYVNPYWRQKWFYLVELCLTSCLYFVVDNWIPK